MRAIEITGIGNAIVDVIAEVEEALLARLDLAKGSMTLIDSQRGVRIYEQMGQGVESSGGSAANTMVGFASLGGRPAYIGKVSHDSLGAVFARDLCAAGVEFAPPKAGLGSEPGAGESTARCLIMVTPDAQRTMATDLGISVQLAPDDLDFGLIAAAQILYLEGYLFDRPLAKQAFLAAAEAAHQAGAKVALTLSDSFCVERHRAEFRDLITNHVDILFANEAEALSLTQSASFDQAVAELRDRCEWVAVTRSARGSVLVHQGRDYEIPAVPPAALVDTTGAGDLYAAGVLFGLVRGMDIPAMGQVGSLAASEVISHLGARPHTRLSGLLAGTA